jgi:hypothetical protein
MAELDDLNVNNVDNNFENRDEWPEVDPDNNLIWILAIG